jgi:hypothetical protein
MQYLTGLMFELHRECNLAESHTWCPAHQRQAWANGSLELRDIERVALVAHREFSFRGVIGFHYYNEPMAQWQRVVSCVKRLSRAIPGQEFALWTNGTYIHPDMAQDLTKFTAVIVSNYGDLDLAMIERTAPHAEIVDTKMDGRVSWNIELDPRTKTPPCFRPCTELIVDYRGDLHICCYDWRGESSPGNVLTDDPAACFRTWQKMRDAILSAKFISDMPTACAHCPQRDLKLQAYCPTVGRLALQYADHLQTKEGDRCPTA